MKKIDIDLIVFDFDGTLTNSIPPAMTAVQNMLKELKFPEKTVKEIEIHVGYGEIPLISGAIGSNDPSLIDKAMARYLENYKKALKDIPLYPHVKETLDHLKDKSMAIISNKKEELIRIILSNHGLVHYFCEVLGGDNSDCLKPDPCMINRILKENMISNERTLFVGDMTVDIQTGRNAKVRTCAVTYGFDPREKLIAEKPDYLINDISQLIDIIK